MPKKKYISGQESCHLIVIPGLLPPRHVWEAPERSLAIDSTTGNTEIRFGVLSVTCNS
jgi:hypothetical protein